MVEAVIIGEYFHIYRSLWRSVTPYTFTSYLVTSQYQQSPCLCACLYQFALAFLEALRIPLSLARKYSPRQRPPCLSQPLLCPFSRPPYLSPLLIWNLIWLALSIRNLIFWFYIFIAASGPTCAQWTAPLDCSYALIDALRAFLSQVLHAV